ncbi:MAG: o-succinylbenzoate--CoA ligase [Haloferacaceae archaeon]
MRDFLSLRAAASPDAMALIEAESSKGWTFRALDAAAQETAGRLAAFGVGPGDHVGVLLPNDVRYVWLVHAAMRLGAVLVPLNVRQTPAELAPRVERAGLSVIVCREDTEEDAVASAGDVPVLSVDSAETRAADAFENAEAVDFEPMQWAMDDPLVVMFTSGTTGTPKAVRLSMGNVLWSAISSGFRLGVDPGDRWLVTLSLYHMGGLAPVYRTALYGSAIVLREEFEAGAAADDIASYDVTGVSLVPVMLRRMLEARGTLADSLRFVLLGGAPASMTLLERCRNYSVPVYPTYGMTEAASQIATATPEETYATPGTVGRPLFFTDVTVRDDDGEEVPAGETGELVVSGPNVVDGYYDDPSATAEAFDEHGLWTGDVGYRDDDGRLWVMNRKDDRIVTGGENVDPGEVVDALRDHPDVQDAAVVGLPDPEWGEEVAALVVRRNDAVSVDDLQAHARGRLAGFKIPRFVAFCDELPRTVSGTVERDAVREKLSVLREQTTGEERTGREADDDPAASTGEAPELDPDADVGSDDGTRTEHDPMQSESDVEQPEDGTARSGGGTEQPEDDIERSGDDTERSGDDIERSGDDIERSGDDTERSGDGTDRSEDVDAGGFEWRDDAATDESADVDVAESTDAGVGDSPDGSAGGSVGGDGASADETAGNAADETAESAADDGVDADEGGHDAGADETAQ